MTAKSRQTTAKGSHFAVGILQNTLEKKLRALLGGTSQQSFGDREILIEKVSSINARNWKVAKADLLKELGQIQP